MSKEKFDELLAEVTRGLPVVEKEETFETSQEEVPSKEEIKEVPTIEIKEDIQSKTEGIIEPPPITYTPNYKYKVKDKEFELDEKAKKYIKTKEDEDFFRDVYTKTTGLDEIKIQRDKLREEHAGLTKEYQGVSNKVKTLDYLESTLANGRYDDFMTTLQRAGLTGKELVKFAHSVASSLEKNPDQVEKERLEFDRQRMEQEKSAYSSESEDKYEKLNQQIFEMKVEAAVNRPEIAAIVKEFNEKFGEGVSGKGAFIEEVAKEGMLHFQQSGEVSDPATLVTSVAKKLGVYLQSSTPAIEVPGTKLPIKTKTIVSAKPNLPNIGSGSDISAIGKSKIDIDSMAKIFEEKLAHRN